MTRDFWRLEALVVSVLLLVALSEEPARQSAAAAGGPIQGLRVAPLPVLGALPLFTAQESGILDRHGLKVVLVGNPGNSDAARQLMNGQIDILYSGIAFALTSAERLKTRVKYLTTGGLQGELAGKKADYEQIMARRGIEIKTARDFEGKHLCVQTLDGGLTHSLSLYLLKKNGVHLDTLIWTAVPFPQMPAALAAGQCDVAVSSQPFTAQILQGNLGYAVDRVLGRSTMVLTALGNPALVTMWWTTQEQFAANPEPFKTFVSAMMEAVTYAYANPEAAINATAIHTRATAESLRSIAFTSVIFHPFGMDAHDVRLMLERWVPVLKEGGFLTSGVDVGSFF